MYGEDERGEMINTLAQITCTLGRNKGEGHNAFFARWELQAQKLNETARCIFGVSSDPKEASS